jgi:predicted small secreted protein
MSENLSNALTGEHLMKTHVVPILIAGVLSRTGCYTVKGVGQDIQKAGSAIEGAAQK